MKRATNPNEFKLKIQGIQSTSDVAREEMDAALETPTDFNPLQEESPFDFSNQPPTGSNLNGGGEASPPREPSSAAAARERALRLLSVRARGRAELARALGERGFVAGAVAEALDRLARAGSARRPRGGALGRPASGAPGYGRARIERELRSRGFSKETIAEAFAAEGAEDREDAALRNAFDRLWKARAHMAPPVRRRRVFDALMRRGFPAERISEIIRGWYEID